MKYVCLSSGGCASKYLEALLKKNGIKNCFHEKKPELNAAGINYLKYKGDNKDKIKSILKRTRKNVFLESSNRLFSLTEPISEVYPDCKFIFLIREPVKWIKSMLRNKEIERIIKTKHRFKYLCGKYKSTEEAVCNYYLNSNNIMLDSLNKLNNDKIHIITMDDLIKGNIQSLEVYLNKKLNVKKISPVNNKKNKFKEFPKKYKLNDLKIKECENCYNTYLSFLKN